MTSKEMASLQDVYEELKAPKACKACYQLQFLWRDLTSDFDVIGPYYSSQKGMESKFIISCLMASIHAFHIYGFKTMVVVCDGASANLKAVKDDESLDQCKNVFHSMPFTSGCLVSRANYQCL